MKMKIINKDKGYIYILYPRACKNCNENVYKVGKTQNYKKRMSKYTKGSIYKLVILVNDYHNIETNLLKLCRLKFIERKDYGNEYFECNLINLNKLVKEITNIEEVIIEEINNDNINEIVIKETIEENLERNLEEYIKYNMKKYIENNFEKNTKNITNDIKKYIEENINIFIEKNIKKYTSNNKYIPRKTEEESEFICKRCGYKTNLKANLKTHLSNKKICNVLFEDIDRNELIKDLMNREIRKKGPYNCKKCGKELATRQSKWKHENTCNKIKTNLDDKDLKELVINLTKEIEELKKNVNVTNNITNNNHDTSIIINNNNINIILDNLRPFGKENYDYIDIEAIKKIIKPARNVLYRFIKMIHFNINHPENWNYFISNMRSNKANIYNGKKFVIDDKVESLIKLIESKKEFLEKFITELEDLVDMEKESALDFLSYFNKKDFECDTERVMKAVEEVSYNSRGKIEIVKNEMDKRNKENYKIELGVNN